MRPINLPRLLVKSLLLTVDATCSETDYIDAGHIRLGETARFMPKGMEILEYRIGKGRNIPGNSTSLIDTTLR